jgi:hypothetical protein
MNFEMGPLLALVETDLSEERIASNMTVKKISELGTLAVTTQFFSS